MRSFERGFTSAELAIAVGLTAVLVAIAASAYKTYVLRSAITAEIARTAPLRHAVEAAYAARAEVPPDLRALGRDGAAIVASLSSLELVDGRIDLRFSAQAGVELRDGVLPLTPYETVEHQVVWICGNRIPGVGLHPLGFAVGGRQAVQIATTIEARYLPARCR